MKITGKRKPLDKKDRCIYVQVARCVLAWLWLHKKQIKTQVARIFHHGRERTKDLLPNNTYSLKGNVREGRISLSQTRKQDISNC